jgi:3-oxoacyl-[acyl-carrier-protein] synthase III
MTTHTAVGIKGIGLHLPAEIRKNDWWPDSVVQGWQEKVNLVRPGHGAADAQTEGARRTLESMTEYRHDPFKGAVERRALPKGVRPSDMEFAAAQDAISRAGVKAEEIDLLMVYSQLPDYLMVPNAPLLHAKLGLNRKCLSLDTQAACNSFLVQYALAEQMIKSGKARNALLIQSSTVSQICRPQDHHSAWFGDGATAVVIGPVADGRGTLSWSHRTDGAFHDALMGGKPGERWWEADQTVLYAHDKQLARNMLLLIADLAKEVVDDALAQSGHSASDVNFYATHQSTYWFRKTTQDYMELKNAKSFDSFAWTGSLGAANIPFMLGMGEREGLLKAGDLVAMYTGGSGITWSGQVMRWGG